MANTLHEQAYQNYRAAERVYVTTTRTLAPYEMTVSVASGTYDLTLPPVSECEGRILSIDYEGAGTDSITVKAGVDVEVDAAAWVDQVMNLVGESVVLYSTGRKWVVLQGQTS